MSTSSEVIIVGGGLAGLSAGIYLGRALRKTLIIDTGRSMARWEPDVQNYLGFPGGISGTELLRRARRQARRYGVQFARDEILKARAGRREFQLFGTRGRYSCRCLLLATGIFHVPPEIPGIKPCVGRSLFFCKDCDGYRVRGKNVAVYGWTNEAVEYALAMLTYTSQMALVTGGVEPRWDRQHAGWIQESGIPVHRLAIAGIRRVGDRLQALHFSGGSTLKLDALFTTRGDIYFNALARALGAAVDESGQVIVESGMRTTVPGLYAAGCVTPANCQMIIAAGQGATAAQAINHDLFQQSLQKQGARSLRSGKW